MRPSIRATLYAIALLLSPSTPTQVQAQVQTSSVSTVPFYTLFNDNGLDTFEAMYVGEGKGNGVRQCLGEAQGVMFDLDAPIETINRTWHINVWYLDRCVSDYYSQPRKTWKQFLTTLPMRRYNEYRQRDNAN